MAASPQRQLVLPAGSEFVVARASKIFSKKASPTLKKQDLLRAVARRQSRVELPVGPVITATIMIARWLYARGQGRTARAPVPEAVFHRAFRTAKRHWSPSWRGTCRGGSTRRVTAITKELCGHHSSANAVSTINQKLDTELTRFMPRRLAGIGLSKVGDLAPTMLTAFITERGQG
jgi:hypothetical protein